MKIDRSNYEIWLIDWIDGNLTDSQVEMLQLFITENPDLQEEFEELLQFNIKPEGKSFHNKERLKKTTADLSESQFEYLSIACLEKDLSKGQQSELMEMIEHDREKRKKFELIQKTKLSPVSVTYKHRNRLIMRTVSGNIIRLSLIGLSAAAIITLVLMTEVLKHPLPQVVSEKPSLIIAAGNPVQVITSGEVSEGIKTGGKVFISEKQKRNLPSLSPKTVLAVSEKNINSGEKTDSLAELKAPHGMLPGKVSFSPAIVLKEEAIPAALITFNCAIPATEVDDERPWLGRLLAKTFRTKILKEKTPKDTPVKVYEIAEAGVSGLDRLFGWQMALVEKKDANGELKSVYFSSKILKFNAPVKKSELFQ